ncbi:universal stress protein [Microvirga massiliensis]|uniref:universal stress protein n=1 Tax=Microvirga massiliensis TaxID=1033741 RepID=UPI00062BAFCD
MLGHVAVALDPRARTREAVSHAVEIAAATSSALTLLHAVEVGSKAAFPAHSAAMLTARVDKPRE